MEFVACDGYGVDTLATGTCRTDGYWDSEGFWFNGSFNVAVGICDECVKAWEEATNEA